MANPRFSGGRNQGDKKSFKSKFSRKGAEGAGSGDSGENRPSFGKKKFEKSDDRKGGFSKERKFSEGDSSERKSDKPFGKRRDDQGSGFSKERKFSKPFPKREGGFSDRKSDRPFSKKRDGEFTDRPKRENRAFSAGKKFFKRADGSRPKKEEGESSFKPRFGKPFFKSGDKFRKPGGAPEYKFKKSFGKRRDVMKEMESEKKSDGLTRLNKYISNSGVCSRREADELIKMGLISVNGKVITEMGFKVKPGDEVRHESKKLTAEKPVYILMNKPKGYITTTDDPQERKTVMGLIGSAVKERIYPVGRLDRNTTGLLLLTNDGELADKLMHPSYKAKKIYRAELDKPLTKADFEKIQEGVRLEEGKAVVDEVAYVDGDPKIIGIEIHIGWNRVVRRIFEVMGYEVLKLDRVVYAGLDKKNIGRGEWRHLKEQEVVKLKHFK